MEKPTVGEKFRALLATGRAANLPTVWCNVLVAFSLSRLSAHHYNADPGRFWTAALAFLLISASCIYVGGCMLGDARDINFDKEHRPNRPLPRGVLSTTFVTISAWGLLFGGLIIVVISALLSAIIAHGIEWRELVNFLGSKNGLIAIQLHEILLASLLTACVIAYAFIHKRNKIVGLALMASCRFLLVFFAISVAHKTFYGSPASAEPLFLYRSWVTSWMPLLALTVGVYTLLLSWVASTEAKPGQFQFRSILATCMLTLPVVSFILVAIIQQNLKFQTQSLGETKPRLLSATPISSNPLDDASRICSLDTLRIEKPQDVQARICLKCPRWILPARRLYSGYIFDNTSFHMPWFIRNSLTPAESNTRHLSE